MMTIGSAVFMGLSALVVVAVNAYPAHARGEMQPRLHRWICLTAVVLGVLARFWRLGSLPAGICAEEALVGVQAKALWQTGGFLFNGHLTTQLSQWAGESSGPLLAVLTAPFVGLFGITSWTVRLPLALLSCAAMPAAYGLGKALAGRRAGRWCLIAYALCPYFILSARMTCGANATVCLLPIALCLLVWGVKRPAALYAGTLVMALMAYTQDMYFFISPAVILLAGIVAAAYGQKKWHALGAALLGLVVCVPALLTLWVNMTGREGFVILDLLEIPKLENFDKANWLLGGLGENGVVWKTVFNQAWAVIVGGIFQVLWHDNISMSLLAPDGFGALYFISVPLIPLGLLALLCRRLEGKRAGGEVRAARTMVLGAGVIAFVMLILFGSEGIQNVNGCTSVYDYSALFLYSVLLMVAGLCRIERRSAAGTCAMGALVCASFVALCVFVVSGSYQMQANVYFVDFAQAAVRAQELGAQNGVKVNVTTSVYPHIQPSAAAEMMYLAATDADMTVVEGQRGTAYELIYARSMVPDPSQVYMVTYEDSMDWDLSPFTYEEIGEYQLLSPKLEP